MQHVNQMLTRDCPFQKRAAKSAFSAQQCGFCRRICKHTDTAPEDLPPTGTTGEPPIHNRRKYSSPKEPSPRLLDSVVFVSDQMT